MTRVSEKYGKAHIEIFGNSYREYYDPNTGEAYLCKGSEIVAETQTRNGLNEVWMHSGIIEDVMQWARSYLIERVYLVSR